MNAIIIITYCLYLAISAIFTVWVATTLFKNGRVFLIHMFRNNYPLADSVNHLLVVGFYLINLGFICLGLRIAEDVQTWKLAIELLSSKIGVVLLTLGAMHFTNLVVFTVIRAATKKADDQYEEIEMTADTQRVLHAAWPEQQTINTQTQTVTQPQKV